ncbi:DUF2796 domain-containing protein [Glaciimonas soli]|uniref:DUF2796 domain-containing protein n=1 Tax=Glaciimonas soli TaxID=2590999 RepID=A0A843YLD4_9BURK|nr:DUF2796 domain-containing protein [Glaciimonas soli]MQQ99739.1 DUF2796 domain-containing protein [Glaciimonas soli]
MKHTYAKSSIVALLAMIVCTITTLPANAHEAHVHGVGTLDVATDGAQLNLHLDTPLMNLLGFEHPANSEKDQLAAKKMAQQLRAAGNIFITTTDAECKLTSVKLESAALTPALLGEPVSAKKSITAPSEHADLNADFVFQCAHPERLKTIDVKLFSAFQGFQKINVQMVTPKKQLAATLTPSAFRISW